MSRRSAGQIILAAAFGGAFLLPQFLASAMDASSTSFYIRQNIFDIGGTGNSSTFRLWNGGGQSGFDVSLSSTFGIYSGPLYELSQSLRPIYKQMHFHWRNDDGTEVTATSATGGSQDTTLTGLARNTPKRLRFEISNEGGTVKGYAAQQFRIEYGAQSSTCATTATYTDVGAAGGDWDMATSSQLTEAGNTTNIAIGSGGVGDDNHAFLVANGGQRESSSQTAAISVSSEQYVDLEYAVQALTAASSSIVYCFRITNAGTSTDFVYTNYATVALSGANLAPSVSAVSLNHGNAITMTVNTTTQVDVNFTVTDLNGCGDVFYNGNVTTTVFRSGVTSACAANTLNCYISVSTSTNNCPSATTTTSTANATITLGIYYFAQATDASSSFVAEDWDAEVRARDQAGATSTANATNRELNTTVGIDVTPATTTYGALPINTNTGSVNQTTTVSNVGNASTTLKVSGIAMCSGSNCIATSSQHYATSTFTFGGLEQLLSDVDTVVSGFVLTAPTSTTAVQSNTYWGFSAPGGSVVGDYTGTNIFTPVWTQ